MAVAFCFEMFAGSDGVGVRPADDAPEIVWPRVRATYSPPPLT